MQTGTQTSYSMLCTGVICSPMPTSDPVSSPYVFLYQANASGAYRLLTWGFVQELNKSNDATVRAVMQQIQMQTQKR